MADKQEIEFTIDDDGNIQIKVIGGQGAACLELTREIEEALGMVTDRQRTSEFYQQPTTTERQVEGQGGA